MSVYSFENKKSVPVRVLSFHFAVGKMKTAVYEGNLWILSYIIQPVYSLVSLICLLLSASRINISVCTSRVMG